MRQVDVAQELTVPEGLDLSVLPADVLRDYALAVAPAQLHGPVDAAAAAAARLVQADEGSNNWALAPERTATGRALLANDPHRTVSHPSLRSIAHLSAPGFDVIGAGEPALPGLSIGHNGHVAFGFTVFPVDQEDLYVYETDPDVIAELLPPPEYEAIPFREQREARLRKSVAYLRRTIADAHLDGARE